MSLFHLFWRWRARQFRQSPRLPVVLLYHSVNSRPRDPLKLSLTPECFEQHLRWLHRNCTVLPVADLVRRHGENTLPADAVAITFDDGYADNVEQAAPLLRKYGLSATVFAATDYVDSPGEGWWDELDAIFLESARLPEHFVFDTFSCRVETRLDPSRSGWTVLDEAKTGREKAFVAASDFVKRLDRERRGAFLRQLREWSGHAAVAREWCRMAQWSDLKATAAEGLLRVGAHTRSHPCLAALSDEQQHAEIATSAAIVREMIGSGPDGFAYPFGTYHDFSPGTLRAVKRSGLRFAFANMPGRITRRRFDIPRLLVWDWTADELARRLGR